MNVGDVVRPKRVVNLRENYATVTKVRDDGMVECKFRGVVRVFRPDDVILMGGSDASVLDNGSGSAGGVDTVGAT